MQRIVMIRNYKDITFIINNHLYEKLCFWIDRFSHKPFKMHIKLNKDANSDIIYFKKSSCHLGKGPVKEFYGFRQELGIDKRVGPKRSYVKKKEKKKRKKKIEKEDDKPIFHDNIEDNCISVKEGKYCMKLD